MTNLQCCNSYFKQAGWHCSEVCGTDGDNTLYISTPIVLSGGKPLDFYVQRKGSKVMLSDDGITMFALRSLGFNLTDKRHWKGLENIAKRHNFSLSENGEFEAVFYEEHDASWGGKMLLFCADIYAWEKEHSSQGDTDFSLTDHVEAILRRMRPDRLIESHATVQIGSSELEFDFKWGNFFVDAIRPSNQAVNARLRKGILMQRIEEDSNVLFIVDDRLDAAKARQELSVLAGVANAIALTDFEQLEDYSS
ncbi:DUF1828 domain-containing protein [Comamonas kerstersii]|uniref:DUF1828 domain-containing protein n=1 Tax=Comamonas kerstersii TaxID=225992 RepID=UPI0026DC367C|nr:DUF1828 domain-containing protein [Comamonas kerstersii]